MTKFSGLLLAFAGMVAASGQVVAESSDSKIVIKNKSAWAIHQLFLSPTDEREWGEDQLGKHTVNTGDSFTLTGVPCRAYDVRLVDEDGDECIVEDVGICATSNTWVIDDEDLVGCQAATQDD
ncbi:MAG TPA: hypothetical protein VLF18_21645 [Tahibacter sp.]|uniref:hypothetical protein n=1 Tax=Tahibacter sp. TaxID=2056211 RepID=UPI002C1D5499|nr:hypothetical protein [Tahibacter sp.]HSX62796.1 hypothetical protein [Tahibacter sp.]